MELCFRGDYGIKSHLGAQWPCSMGIFKGAFKFSALRRLDVEQKKLLFYEIAQTSSDVGISADFFILITMSLPQVDFLRDLRSSSW